MIGDTIKLIREHQNISKAALSRLTKLNPSYITRIENNERIPSDEAFLTIKSACGYADVPITKEEVDAFKKKLYLMYNLIKNKRLQEARLSSDKLRPLTEKCFDDEVKILYELFEGYLLQCEAKYSESSDKLKNIECKIRTDEQKYYYYYLYGTSIYEDYKKSLEYLLKAEELGRLLRIQESNLYYAIANIYARIDYSGKSILYGTIALEIAKRSSDKCYLLEIEATLAFEYGKVGCYQISIENLNGCLTRDKINGCISGIHGSYHNIGCVYALMKDYDNAFLYFDKALAYCKHGSIEYFNNQLAVVDILIDLGQRDRALEIIEQCLSSNIGNDDLVLFFESSKCLLNLDDEYSIEFIETTVVPRLIALGKNIKAVKVLSTMISFFESKKNNRKYNKKINAYSKLALRCTTKVLKGDL